VDLLDQANKLRRLQPITSAATAAHAVRVASAIMNITQITYPAVTDALSSATYAATMNIADAVSAARAAIAAVAAASTAAYAMDVIANNAFATKGIIAHPLCDKIVIYLQAIEMLKKMIALNDVEIK